MIFAVIDKLRFSRSTFETAEKIGKSSPRSITVFSFVIVFVFLLAMTRLSPLRQQNRSVKLINRSHSAMASPGEGLLQINDKKVTMGGGECPKKVMF